MRLEGDGVDDVLLHTNDMKGPLDLNVDVEEDRDPWDI